MCSCGAAAATARYSSKHAAAGVTATYSAWFIIRSRLFCHLSVGEPFISFSYLILMTHWSSCPSKHAHPLCCGWLECSCPYAAAQLGDILSYPNEQMPEKSNLGLLPEWRTVLSLPQFLYCYEIIDEEKPTHVAFSHKQLMLRATAHAWPFSHT